MVINLSENHSLIGTWVSELRHVDTQQDRLRFRRNLERIGEVAAYEISKTLPFHEVEVPTPLGTAPAFVLQEQPVLATILRAGLPLHQGLLNYFDRADNFSATANKYFKKTVAADTETHGVFAVPFVQGSIERCRVPGRND